MYAGSARTRGGSGCRRGERGGIGFFGGLRAKTPPPPPPPARCWGTPAPFLGAGAPPPAVLLLVDSDVLLEGRDSPARRLLGHGRPAGSEPVGADRQGVQVSGIVVAATVEQLPANCTTVVDVGHDARGLITRPDDQE